MLSSEAHGEEAMKRQVFMNGINGSWSVARKWKMTKEVVIQDLTELTKMLKNCGIWCI
jgi:hypothetical protein